MIEDPIKGRTRRLGDTARQRSRSLRREMTKSERLLWDYLRNRTFGGFKFVRQHPIGPYFADFVCRKAKLVVELDGQGHDQAVAYDERRDAFLELRGYRVLRVSSSEMIRNPECVLSQIEGALGSQ